MPSITAEKREQIRTTLKQLAEVNAANMQLLETMSSLLSLEFSLDSITIRRSLPAKPQSSTSQFGPVADSARLSIIYRGNSCFLGNSLPFRFFARLARRPNVYLTYEELLADVWHNGRSDEAIRSVVKTLRNKLRQAGMGDLAEAIDGSNSGHYGLRLG